jgi:hypothetical protein
VGTLKPGVYFVSVYNTNGKQDVKKIIKKQVLVFFVKIWFLITGVRRFYPDPYYLYTLDVLKDK